MRKVLCLFCVFLCVMCGCGKQQEENKDQPEAARGMSLDKITEALLVCIGTLCSEIDDNSKQKKKSKAKSEPPEKIAQEKNKEKPSENN